MKKIFFGFMLFIGGLLTVLTIINVSYEKYGFLSFIEFGRSFIFFLLVTIVGLIISGYEAFFKKD